MTDITFDEALDATGGSVGGQRCVIRRALDELSPENRAMAERALANPKISDRRIAEAFERLLGERAPSRSPIYNHRQGRHKSCVLSTTR